jgi:hypothetical protein
MSEENGGEAGQNGAFLSDPVDVIIEKLLRYVFTLSTWIVIRRLGGLYVYSLLITITYQ